ncbi:pentatricopeptide repeat-containing protein At4g21705, mitochondrial-like [Bidens hawaiensis]|uniref:pentatricopeptide repeat-containing protein At4g21705, mitochondrial-like n=1 Tax=Bidens hawaiensis TaxID=980011 RepID=UPI004049C2DC
MLSMAGRLRSLQNAKTQMRLFGTMGLNESNKNNKVTLYSRISPLGDPSLAMTPELNDWIDTGKKVRVSEVKQIIHDLRKRRRFHHALEVSEWMNKKGLCAFTPTDHAVQLDLIGKVNGFLEAEKYFNGLTEQDKTGKTYGALLHCYVRQRETEKALSLFQKMKENGLVSSPVTYNDIMSLYVRTHEADKVHDLLNEMKKNGVSPDNLSYRTLINVYGDKKGKMDIYALKKILKEMEDDSNIVMDWNTYTVVANCYIKGNLLDKASDALKKAEKLVGKDGLAYNHVISLHARLGNKDDVIRVWGQQKSACKRRVNRDYITIMTSLVRLGEFEEVEKVLTEWNSSGNVYDFRVPSIVIEGYVKKGLCDEAKDLLDRLVKDDKSTMPDSWAAVAVEFMKKGDVGACITCVESLINLRLKGDWELNSDVVEKLLEGVGEKGRVDDVDALVKELKKFMKFDRGMYHSLMKGCINGGKEVGKVLKHMIDDGIE